MQNETESKININTTAPVIHSTNIDSIKLKKHEKLRTINIPNIPYNNIFYVPTSATESFPPQNSPTGSWFHSDPYCLGTDVLCEDVKLPGCEADRSTWCLSKNT